jgi:hypothetical protein
MTNRDFQEIIAVLFGSSSSICKEQGLSPPWTRTVRHMLTLTHGRLRAAMSGRMLERVRGWWRCRRADDGWKGSLFVTMLRTGSGGVSLDELTKWSMHELQVNANLFFSKRHFEHVF